MALYRVAALAATAAVLSSAALSIIPLPAAPAFGVPVSVQLTNTEFPQFLPAMRYFRTGNVIVVEYEYLLSDFGPTRPDFGFKAMALGELVPGAYVVHARLFEMTQPDAAPRVVTAGFQVAPPPELGLHLVPRAPGAWQAASVLVRSAVYFDPASMRVAREGNVLRVDFDYAPGAPVGGPVPPGYVAFAAVGIEALAPGAYRIDGWGRATPDGVPEQFFTRELAIGNAMPVVEYYNPILDHYFMAGGPDEVALLDAGAHGGWRRTGQHFKAWLRQAEAPANARPLCRFYAFGPNSHFYTADAFECQQLKDLEVLQRAKAASEGTRFLGWGFEGIGSWALMPENGQCPPDSDPVYRSYNDRAAENDSNHRFTRDPQLHAAMLASSGNEGIQLCSPR